MPIVVTEACRPWWNYQIHDLAAGDIIPDGEFATHLLTTGAPVVEQTDTTPDVTGDGVPDGTVADVMGWVADDPAKAALALRAENERSKPRSTLIADLEKLAAPAVQPPAVESPPAEPAQP